MSYINTIKGWQLRIYLLNVEHRMQPELLEWKLMTARANEFRKCNRAYVAKKRAVETRQIRLGANCSVTMSLLCQTAEGLTRKHSCQNN